MFRRKYLQKEFINKKEGSKSEIITQNKSAIEKYQIKIQARKLIKRKIRDFVFQQKLFHKSRSY